MAMGDLAAKSNYYYDAEKRLSNPRHTQQQLQGHQQDKRQYQPQQQSKPRYHSEHEVFCDQMGIMFPNGLNSMYTVRKRSYFYDRKREFRSHTHQYWFIATLTTAFFLLQVVIGAIQTALGATHSPHPLVTVFGAIATVIGGILAYLKSRGQPNRTRQLRNSLRKVVREIEFQETQLRNPEIKTTAREAADYVNQLYEDARFQAETNYPDFWSTAGTKATKPGSGVAGPATFADNRPIADTTAPHGSAQPGGSPPQPAPSYANSMRPVSNQQHLEQPPSNQDYSGPVPPITAAHVRGEGTRQSQGLNTATQIPPQEARHAR